jgi:hypothetical protein
MDDVLLASGIVTFQVGNTIYENNLKARPYTSKGKFVEFKRDTNGEPIFIFKSGDSLIEYKYRVMNDGSLDLYQISNPGNPEPQITNYGMELDNLIQSREFIEFLKTDTELQALFNKLGMSNFNESLYTKLESLNALKRKAFLQKLKGKIETTSELKDKVSIIDNLITPPKC